MGKADKREREMMQVEGQRRKKNKNKVNSFFTVHRKNLLICPQITLKIRRLIPSSLITTQQQIITFNCPDCVKKKQNSKQIIGCPD